MGKFSLAEQMRTRSPDRGPRDLEAITREILDCKVRAGEAIMEIGRCLLEAKGQLEHGQWCTWLEERVEFSQRTAQNFMRLAREWSNPQALADLGATKALLLLTLSPTEREAFLEESHEVYGEEKTVIDMSARELEKAIREREEAIADKKIAEAARVQMAADMQVVNQRLAAVNDQLRQKEQSAREEAESRLKKKLEQAEREKQEVLEALERTKAESQKSAGSLRALAQEAEEERTALEKRLKLAVNPAATEFQYQFSAAGASMTRLLDCLEQLRDDGEMDLHNRLSDALEALARQLLDRIPVRMDGGGEQEMRGTPRVNINGQGM